MLRICAWCKAEMGESRSNSLAKKSITHGICEACLEYFSKYDVDELRYFLEELKVPVMAIDENAVVITANSPVQKLLSKSLEDIEGFRGGEVISCKFSYEEGGCGNTVHCDGCTIRNSVIKTYATGVSKTEILAYRDIITENGIVTMHFLISTRLLNDMVLLRIDKASVVEKVSV